MALFNVHDEALLTAARTAVRESLKIKKDETVLIITNPNADVAAISQALYNECGAVGARPVMTVQPEKTSLDFTEPSVLGAIKTAPDVLISVSSEKMGKDFEAIRHPYEFEGKKIDNTFHYLMKQKKTRSFWSPGVTKDLFVKTVPVDYAEMKERCRILKSFLDRAEGVRIRTAAGTDLTMGLRNRIAFTDDGDFSVPGEGGNLPAGEAFISPELGTGEGILVFDGSIAVRNGTVKIDTPIRCTVRGGFVTAIEGGEEAEILRQISQQLPVLSLHLEYVGSVAGDAPRSRSQQRTHHTHQRCLACAVHSQKSVNAVRHPVGHIIDSSDTAEILCNIIKSQFHISRLLSFDMLLLSVVFNPRPLPLPGIPRTPSGSSLRHTRNTRWKE